jgi:hypothetical protein
MRKLQPLLWGGMLSLALSIPTLAQGTSTQDTGNTGQGTDQSGRRDRTGQDSTTQSGQGSTTQSGQDSTTQSGQSSTQSGQSTGHMEHGQRRGKLGGDFKKMDADKDGRISRSEWLDFDQMDTDKDGYLTGDELKMATNQGRSGRGASSTGTDTSTGHSGTSSDRSGSSSDRSGSTSDKSGNTTGESGSSTDKNK